MRGTRRLAAVLAVGMLAAGCGNGRYEFKPVGDGTAVCRLDTRTGEVVCAPIVPRAAFESSEDQWTAIREAR